MGILDKLPRCNTACFGKTIRTASLIIGWFNFISLGLLWSIYLALIPYMLTPASTYYSINCIGNLQTVTENKGNIDNWQVGGSKKGTGDIDNWQVGGSQKGTGDIDNWQVGGSKKGTGGIYNWPVFRTQMGTGDIDNWHVGGSKKGTGDIDNWHVGGSKKGTGDIDNWQVGGSQNGTGEIVMNCQNVGSFEKIEDPKSKGIICLIALLLTDFFIVQCLLLWGVIKKKHRFLLPWIVFTSLIIVVTALGSIAVFVLGVSDQPLLLIILIPLNFVDGGSIYFFLIITSYYREIRDEQKRNKISAHTNEDQSTTELV